MDVEAALGRALAVLSEGVRLPAPDLPKADRPKAARIVVGTAAEGATVKEGSYVLIGDALHQVLDGEPRPVSVKSSTVKEGIFAKHARILRGLIPVRDAVRAVLRAQEANEPWGTLQTRLRVAYNSFVRQFGPINHTTVSHRTDEATGEVTDTVRRPNLQPFLDDPDCWLVASIEDYDVESDTAKPGPVFSQRVIHPPVEPVITSAADALAVTLHEVGHVDLARVAELIGRSREETLAELGEAVFLNPSLTTEGFEVWETADAYLSGAVRTKLAAAEAAAVLRARLRPQRGRAAPGAARGPAAVRHHRPAGRAVDPGRGGGPVLGRGDRHRDDGAPHRRGRGVVDRPAGLRRAGRRHVGVGHPAAPCRRAAARRAERGDPADLRHLEGCRRRAPGAERGRHRGGEGEARQDQGQLRALDLDGRGAHRAAGAHLQRPLQQPRPSHLRRPPPAPARCEQSVISLREHQKRVIWRIISSGSTYIAHAVGAGKTYSMAAAIMEQRRLGLITKAMMTVPGHCLAQASREFLQLYPNAKILVADETNFVKEKRQRFLARAATGIWDCIIITHSAFKFIPAPAAFEEGLIQAQLQSYADLLEKADSDDRITRKRIERMKEGLEAKLEALGAVKDDMLTISEIGVDQIVVDEAQEFRKLSFPTNMSNLRGVAPDGSQRAWDLYVKSRFVALTQPQRPLILASGTPITNTLGEMFTLQRFMQPDVLEERGLHEFDAWASSFGDTRTELELQPSGNYKPITRFAEFVNVPELIAMFRSVADVVLKDDLRQFMRLPDIRGGKRQIVTAPASPAFKAYQKVLARRIKIIEQRKGKPNKGDDILLSVITDGRHAAIDMRFVVPSFEDDPREGNDPHNKLNAMIGNIHRIWLESADRTYRRPDGSFHPLRGGAQMVFSDLGTEAADGKRGFSAYLWVRDELIRLGVPREQIAFMQDYKKSAAKQGLFNDVNAGKVRILLGSTQTMGTGVNAQQRLVALHHLDVPWLPSDIEQREGRIERQGNQNEEIELYAYATLGSVDATSWQLLERKARFIAAALAGDRTIRRLEDVDGQANQFAMAKALASGDQRLMQKAGIEAEVARLRRLHAAHFDDQHAIAQNVRNAEAAIRSASTRIAQIEEDLRVRVSTRGDAFAMVVGKKPHTERKVAGGSLLSKLRLTEKALEEGTWTMGQIGGFDLRAQGKSYGKSHYRMDLWLERTGYRAGGGAVGRSDGARADLAPRVHARPVRGGPGRAAAPACRGRAAPARLPPAGGRGVRLPGGDGGQGGRARGTGGGPRRQRQPRRRPARCRRCGVARSNHPFTGQVVVETPEPRNPGMRGRSIGKGDEGARGMDGCRTPRARGKGWVCAGRCAGPASIPALRAAFAPVTRVRLPGGVFARNGEDEEPQTGATPWNSGPSTRRS